jgi:hypothetical protein
MARKCTVCEHAERTEIEKAMIRNESFQNIATHFNISVGAAWRHAKSHLPQRLLETKAAHEAAIVAAEKAKAEAKQEAERAGANDVMAELGRCFNRANLLFEACDRWLRDPDNPEQYDINPRAEDVWVTFVEATENGTPRLRKEGLPICSVADQNGGGYYLASASSDAEDYLRRLRHQALKKLAMEARIRKVALPELLGQISVALAREEK